MPANVFRTLGPVQVEIKSAWPDSWVVRPNIIPLNASAAAGAIGQFQFSVPYGLLKHPGESSIELHDYSEISREWVRVKTAPYGDNDILFQGRIEVDNRELFGPGTGGPAGIQTFTAFDGVSILQKTAVNRTRSRDIGSETYRELKTVVPFNMHPNSRNVWPNRSLSLRDSGGLEHYVFQAKGTKWRVIDAIEYLVAEFLNGSGDSSVDPQWDITAPVGALTEEIEPMMIPSGATVLTVLNALLGKQYGYGWAVVPKTTGFELRLDTLTGTAVTYGDVTIPANANLVAFDTDNPDAQIQIERSFVDTYGTLRVYGRPMIVVRSFRRSDEQVKFAWSDDEQASFLAATEEERESDRFANVFQRYIAFLDDPALWQSYHNPQIDPDGVINTGVKAPLPQLTKSTLESLPLLSFIDYSDPDSEIPESLEDLDTELYHSSVEDRWTWLRPAVFMRKRTDPDYWENVINYVGGSLFVLPDFLGVQLDLEDPIAVANSAEAGSDLDYTSAILTLAFESTERLEFSYSLPGAKVSDGVFELEVPEAEVWYASEGTLYECFDGQQITIPESRSLRNDRLKLQRIMAGLIVRYTQARNRAVVNGAKGLWPWHKNLLHILAAAADDTDASEISAPITHVSWNFQGDFMTSMSTGYAI